MPHCLILSNRCYVTRIVGIPVAKRTCGTHPENFDMTQTKVRKIGNRNNRKKDAKWPHLYPQKRLLAHYEDACKKRRLKTTEVMPLHQYFFGIFTCLTFITGITLNEWIDGSFPLVQVTWPVCHSGKPSTKGGKVWVRESSDKIKDMKRKKNTNLKKMEEEAVKTANSTFLLSLINTHT